MNPELVAQNEARLKRDVVRMAFMTDSWISNEELMADPKSAKGKAHTNYNVKCSVKPFFMADFPNHMKFGHIEMQSTADLPIPGLRPVPPPRAPEPLALSTDSRRFRED